MEIRRKCKDTYEDGNSRAEYDVNGVNDINDVIQVINYFADEYGEMGNFIIRHKNKSGLYDFGGDYDTVEELSSFKPEYYKYLETVEFRCLEQYVYFDLDLPKKQLFVHDRSKSMGPKFYSTDPAVRYAYYIHDDYGLRIRFDRNTSNVYTLSDDGRWLKNNYFYGKILDGDLREIDYDPSVTD